MALVRPLRPALQIGVRADQVQTQRIAWRSRGRIARGKITVLDGDPGLGKSTLLMDWAARVSRGDPLPDGDPQDERGVLLVCAEDDPADTIVPRLKVAGAALEQILILTEVPITDEHGNIPDPDAKRLISLPLDVPMIEELIVVLNVGLVIIDPLMAFLDPELRANSDQDIRTALTPLAAALQRTNASAILVRHLNKSASANALYRGGGSIGIIGIARFGLMVARARDDRDARVLASTKGNLGPPPASLGYRLEGVEGEDVARVVWTGVVHDSADDLLGDTLASDEQKEQANTAEQFLLEYLKGGPASRQSITADAKRVGISTRAIDRAKQRIGIQHTRLGKHLGPAEAIWVWHLPGQDLSGLMGADWNTGAGHDGHAGHGQKTAEVRAEATQAPWETG